MPAAFGGRRARVHLKQTVRTRFFSEPPSRSTACSCNDGSRRPRSKPVVLYPLLPVRLVIAGTHVGWLIHPALCLHRDRRSHVHEAKRLFRTSAHSPTDHCRT